MSQQINLILPEFRPRFDWLALPLVVSGAVCALLVVSAVASGGAWRAGQLAQREAEQKSQLQSLQQQVTLLAQALGARKGDAQLDKQIEVAKSATAERREVLAAVSGAVSGEVGYSSMLQGFAQRTVAGVWLTDFAFAGREVEIRGRLSDAALLPAYIEKLNGEPAFAGRHFARLDMKAVNPALAAENVAAAKTSASKPVMPAYTEFALRSERVTVPEATR